MINDYGDIIQESNRFVVKGFIELSSKDDKWSSGVVAFYRKHTPFRIVGHLHSLLSQYIQSTAFTNIKESEEGMCKFSATLKNARVTLVYSDDNPEESPNSIYIPIELLEGDLHIEYEETGYSDDEVIGADAVVKVGHRNLYEVLSDYQDKYVKLEVEWDN